MDGSRDREEWRRERSLLALGRAMRGDDDAPPPRPLPAAAEMTGGADDRMDARARHGLARERRQASSGRTRIDPQAWPAPRWDGDDRLAGEEQDEADAPAWAAPAPLRSTRHGQRRRRPSWRLVAATVVLGTCLGAATAFSLPARYQATAELTLDGEGAGWMAAGAVDSQLRVLTSGMVLTKVVDRLNLVSDPEFNGRDGGSGLAGLLPAVLMRDAPAADDGQRQALAVDHLAGVLSVASAGAGSIAVTATTGSGDKSALIANAVADTFVELYEQNRSGAVTGDKGAADSRPDDAVALAAAQRRLDDFALAHGLGDLAGGPDRIAEILQLDEDLATARSRTGELNAKVASLRTVGVGAAAAGLPREFETGAIEALRAKYLDLKQQADSAAVKLGPRNPELRAIEAQLAGARDRLSAELRRIVAVQQAALKQAVETEQGYAASLARTGLTGEDIAALRDLRQAVAMAGVDRQAITASVPADASGTAGQGAHVVSRAEAPLQPSGPSRMLLTLAGSVLGLFAGLGIGVLRGGAGGEAEAGFERLPADDARSEEDQRTDWNHAGHPPDDPQAFPVTGRAPWSADGAQWPAAQLYRQGSFDPPAIPDSTETAMYPAYPDQPHPQSRHPHGQQWPQPAEYPPYPPQPQSAMPPAVQYYAPPYPPQLAYPPQHAYPQAWQPAPPMPAYPYPQASPAYAGGQHYPPQPSFGYPPQEPGPAQAIDRSTLDEIRASLHEFREALRELAESRSRRRIF